MTVRVTYVFEGEIRPDRKLCDEGKPFVVVFWHGRQFILFHIFRKSRCLVLTSLSEAGEVQKWVLRSFGHSAIRGSSTRGGAASIVTMIKKIKKERRNAAFAVDGPRGPVYEAKPGAIQTAVKSGAYILPVTSAYKRSKVFDKLWDKYHFPMPFTRGVVKFGIPRSFPPKLTEEGLKQEIEAITEELNKITRESDAFFGLKSKE